MRAVILAAGYATRLYPLTQSIAKPLLPVGGRPMLDHILERIAEVDEVDRVHVVTNRKFAASFERWADAHDGALPIDVQDDGTTSEDDRLGAIGDVQFVVDNAGLGDTDLLVVAGDNLFDFSLADLVAFWHGKGEASAIGLYDVGDLELVKQYGVVELDGDDRMVSMVEKPPDPRSTLAATATYLYHRAHVPLVREYLDEGNSPDQPGRFIVWLHTRAPVYGYRFTGEWLDVGDRGQLLEADNRLRARAGLEPRAEYSLD